MGVVGGRGLIGLGFWLLELLVKYEMRSIKLI